MGAGVMLLCNNKTLILKRANYKHDRFSGYWNFPGGQAEPNETTYQTALRETYEETCISHTEYKVMNHVETRMYTMYIGILEYEAEPILDSEHIEWKWIDIAEIPKMRKQLHPKDWTCFKRHYKIFN